MFAVSSNTLKNSPNPMWKSNENLGGVALVMGNELQSSVENSKVTAAQAKPQAEAPWPRWKSAWLWLSRLGVPKDATGGVRCQPGGSQHSISR